MLADTKWIREVILKEVDSRGRRLKVNVPPVSLIDLLDFELYTQVEHNRTLVQTQASAINSFIHGQRESFRHYQKNDLRSSSDWINGSDDEHTYSCVMSCSSSALGLLKTNEEDTLPAHVVCSIPVRMRGHEELEPIELNFSEDNRTTFTRIVKVRSCLSSNLSFDVLSL